MAGINENVLAQAIVQQTLAQAAATEAKLDATIAQLDNLNGDDLETIRRRRIVELQERAAKMAEWKRLGHGEYSEVADQKEWFEEVKNNERVVCHFYRPSTWRCQIVDKHLALLAPKHMETRFIKIDAEKSPFLCERLSVVLLPTILCTKDGFTHDRIEGFDDLGGKDTWTSEELQTRLGSKGNIDYEARPSQAAAKKQAVKDNPTGAAIYASRRQAMMADLSDDDSDGDTPATTTSSDAPASS